MLGRQNGEGPGYSAPRMKRNEQALEHVWTKTIVEDAHYFASAADEEHHLEMTGIYVSLTHNTGKKCGLLRPFLFIQFLTTPLYIQT